MQYQAQASYYYIVISAILTMARPVYPQNLEDPDIIWLIRNYRNQMAEHQIWVYDVPGEPIFLMKFENKPSRKIETKSHSLLSRNEQKEANQDNPETRESE